MNLRIYNSTDRLFTKENITSLNEEWTVPGNDTYDFWFFTLEGTSEVHVTLQKAGAGLDLTLMIIVAAIVAAAAVGFLLLLRMRKRSSAALPPPPPPP